MKIKKLIIPDHVHNDKTFKLLLHRRLFEDGYTIIDMGHDLSSREDYLLLHNDSFEDIPQGQKPPELELHIELNDDSISFLRLYPVECGQKIQHRIVHTSLLSESFIAIISGNDFIPNEAATLATLCHRLHQSHLITKDIEDFSRHPDKYLTQLRTWWQNGFRIG